MGKILSKTLIISDNEILNQLSVINFDVYLATKVTITQTTLMAMNLIKSGESFDLIISLNMINGSDSATSLIAFLEVENKKIPIIIIGKPFETNYRTVFVPHSFNLQALLRASAEILGITAKKMADLEVPNFIAIEAKFLNKVQEAPCSIYLQIKSHNEDNIYTLIAKKGARFTKLLEQLVEQKIETFYVGKFDRLTIINSISNQICEDLKNAKSSSVNEKSKVLNNGFEFAAKEFCLKPDVAQDIMNIAAECTVLMEDVVKTTPGLKVLIQMLLSHKASFIYTHSILASFVSHHVIKKMSWGSDEHVEKINFVLFFHDIVLAPVYVKHPGLKYEEDLLFSLELSNEEKEIVLNHARLAAEIIITYKRLPIGADLLIKQHHGMTNGAGFALDFKDDISPLSKIMIISEAFIDEFMKEKELAEDYQINVKKIISQLYTRFPKSTYKRIVETLDTLTL